MNWSASSLKALSKCGNENSEPFLLEDFRFFNRTPYEVLSEGKRLIFQSCGVEGGNSWCVRTNEKPSRVVLHGLEIVGEGLATICNRPFAE